MMINYHYLRDGSFELRGHITLSLQLNDKNGALSSRLHDCILTKHFYRHAYKSNKDFQLCR